jgi:hypothetical protein
VRLTWLDSREGLEELAYDLGILAACAQCFLSSKKAGRLGINHQVPHKAAEWYEDAVGGNLRALKRRYAGSRLAPTV